MKNKLELKEWKKQNRFKVQVFVLVFSLILPFLLFFALQNGWVPLSVIFFCLIAIGMGLIGWVS